MFRGALWIRPGGWRTISSGSTVQTSCARRGLALGGGLTTVPVDPNPPPAPLPLGPPNAQHAGKCSRPTWPASTEHRSPADQTAGTTSSFKAKKAVVPKRPSGLRYLRAKNLKVFVEGEPQGVGET